MPLSPASPRDHFHTRDISLKGYYRADGLWDIEAHLTDVKTYAFENAWRGHMAPGTPIHDMWIRLTVDNDLTVQAIEAVTDGSPFEICPAITSNFQRIVGLRIASGWTQAIKERLGGTEGCTHLVELLGPVATVAFQTVSTGKARARALKEAAAGTVRGDPPAMPRPASGRRPPIIDTCHALASDGPVVAQFYPDYYTGSPAPADS